MLLLIGCIALFSYGIKALNGTKDIHSVWKIGFGTVDSRTIINFNGISHLGSVRIIQAILIANAPQPLISAAYFLYNSQFTAMAKTTKS